MLFFVASRKFCWQRFTALDEFDVGGIQILEYSALSDLQLLKGFAVSRLRFTTSELRVVIHVVFIRETWYWSYYILH